MNTYDWKAIHILYACKSISQTADTLSVSQPALTKRLQKIEKELETTIAIRKPSGLVFTPQGEYIAKFAHKMIIEYQALLNTLNDFKLKHKESVRIGASNFLTYTLLPSLISDFNKAYPNIKCDVISAPSNNLNLMVQDGRIHIGFVQGNTDWNCESIVIKAHRLSVISSTPLGIEMLPTLPRIDIKFNNYLSISLDNWWFRNFQAPPYIMMVVPSFDICIDMVRRGLGYAILPDSKFVNDATGLFTIPVTNNNGEPILRQSFMIFKEQCYSMYEQQMFIEHAVKHFKKHNM